MHQYTDIFLKNFQEHPNLCMYHCEYRALLPSFPSFTGLLSKMGVDERRPPAPVKQSLCIFWHAKTFLMSQVFSVVNSMSVIVIREPRIPFPETLFHRILANNNHVLQSYLPDRSRSQYNLRTGAHSEELIIKTSPLSDRDSFMRICCTKDATEHKTL